MILDELKSFGRYVKLHPLFAKAFEFLATGDLASLPTGRNEIDGDRLYVMVVRGDGKGDKTRLEAHRKYIDIQFALAGADRIGWKPTAACTGDGAGFNDAKDVEFFKDAPDCWITTAPGSFAIFFPADAHAPMGATGPLHKIVVKILDQ